MKNNYSWVSEYQRDKFLKRTKNKKLGPAPLPQDELATELNYQIPKIIAVMLDLDGTTTAKNVYLDGKKYNINDEKAQIFINKLDTLRRNFGADTAYISLSTHRKDAEKIKETLDILSPHLNNKIRIGNCFYFGGIYDYRFDESSPQVGHFNLYKVAEFDKHYLCTLGRNTVWFALIDDDLEDYFTEYQNRIPMVQLMPSNDEESTQKNNFMRLATTTKGFDGVLEILDIYMESIQGLSLKDILAKQQNMMIHLSWQDLMRKIKNHEFAYLERYFAEGYANEDDYTNASILLFYLANHGQFFTEEDILYLQRIFDILMTHFTETNNEENMGKIAALKRIIAAKI